MRIGPTSQLMNTKEYGKAGQSLTWVATYAIDGIVTCVIPWIRALPDRVALGSFSTELGEVKMCL